MLKPIQLFYCLLFVLLVTSCEKAETPVVLPKPEGKKFEFNLGDSYNNQVYVNLEHGELITVDATSWDIAFNCDPRSKDIYMNGGQSVLIAETRFYPYFVPVHLDLLEWAWDPSDGNPDSLMLSNWCDPFGNGHDRTYVIDRGPSYGEDERYFQFKLIGTNPYYYHLVFADIYGTNMRAFDIPRDPMKNQIYFSFGNGGEVLNFEPERSSWDFCFMRCRWIYNEFNPPLLYSVAGTQINSEIISVATDSTLAFNEVGIAHFSNYQFHNRRDILGFDWKVPVFKPTGVTYRTRDYVTYLIRKRVGHHPEQLYKLRFIDFYNTQGDKGHPVYELVRLK